MAAQRAPMPQALSIHGQCRTSRGAAYGSANGMRQRSGKRLQEIEVYVATDVFRQGVCGHNGEQGTQTRAFKVSANRLGSNDSELATFKTVTLERPPGHTQHTENRIWPLVD
jgi:hypothetical protein